MKYFVYLRKSTESEDKQALSIESQRDEALKLIEQRKITEFKIFIEEKSASKPGRPKFEEMIRHLTSDGPYGIICWNLNRLARNPIDGGAILWALHEKRILEIITPANTYTPETNVILLHVEFGMAHQYVRSLSVDTKRGLQSKIAKGQYPGQAPIGYQNVGIDKGFREVTIDPKTAPFVRKVFKLFETGKHSLDSLAEKLDLEYRSLSETSLKWKAYVERKGSRRKIRVFEKLHTSKVERIIRNPFYYGDFIYAGQQYKGVHQPLVTKTQWDKVNKILSTPYQGKINPPKHEFYYRGKKLLVCGECGCSITAEVHIKKSGLKFIYYHCTKMRGRCSQPFISERDLEPQLAALFTDFTLNETDALKIQGAIENLKHEDMELNGQLKKNLQARLTKLENEKKALFRKLATTEFPEEEKKEYEKVKEEILLEVSEVNHQLRGLEQENPEWFIKASNLIKLATEAKKLFLAGNREQKQKMLNEVASNLILKDKNVLCTYKKSVEVLVKRDKFDNLGG